MSNEPHRYHSFAANTRATPDRRSWWLIMFVLIIGMAIGRGISNGPTAIAADPNPDATATRVAELSELNDLRTQVALPVVCTPPPEPTSTNTPVPTSTPTVAPPLPLGQKFLYANMFTITVTGIGPGGTPGGMQPQGMFLSVNLIMENLTNTQQWPPYTDWRLVTSAGREYAPDTGASQEVFGRAWGLTVAANLTQETGLVFDVPVDAGNVFILESVNQPEFRIELILESRG